MLDCSPNYPLKIVRNKLIITLSNTEGTKAVSPTILIYSEDDVKSTFLTHRTHKIVLQWKYSLQTPRWCFLSVRCWGDPSRGEWWQTGVFVNSLFAENGTDSEPLDVHLGLAPTWLDLDSNGRDTLFLFFLLLKTPPRGLVSRHVAENVVARPQTGLGSSVLLWCQHPQVRPGQVTPHCLVTVFIVQSLP